MKTKIRNLSLFVSVLLLILFAADMLFGIIIRKNPSSKVNWVFQKQNTAYYMAVLGSSRAYQCIDVETFTEALGQSAAGINMGILGGSYEESSMIFRHFLDNNNSAKLLLVQVDIEGLDANEFKSLRIANFLPYIGEPPIFHVLKDRFGNWAYILKYVPFFKYAEFNEEIGPKRIIESLVTKSKFTNTGTALVESAFACHDELFHKTPHTYNINSARESYLRSILKLARRNKMETCLVMAPYYSDANQPKTNRDVIIAYYKSLAKEYEIPFITLEDPKICSDQKYFFDCEHVNKEGAILFTRFLAEQYLKNTRIVRNP